MGRGGVCRKLWLLLLFQQSATAQIHKCLLGTKYQVTLACTTATTTMKMRTIYNVTRLTRRRGRFHRSVGSGGVRKGGAADVATGKNPPLLRYNPALHCSKSISVVHRKCSVNTGPILEEKQTICWTHCTFVHCTLYIGEKQGSAVEWW